MAIAESSILLALRYCFAQRIALQYSRLPRSVKLLTMMELVLFDSILIFNPSSSMKLSRRFVYLTIFTRNSDCLAAIAFIKLQELIYRACHLRTMFDTNLYGIIVFVALNFDIFSLRIFSFVSFITASLGCPLNWRPNNASKP